ncbi:CocE/NonD family hydrolase [Siccationidurans soli]|uniref:CocE/NonD family hydrolase n=2 Tax=Hymenobacter negativus TaxID=2795026 RepID=A0ABS3QLX6_9BACT|nr:CocE/NonD family hydrolase [Hymenobacter negativus]
MGGYVMQDSFLIKTSQGHTLSAVVVRRRDVTAPQPVALLFFLYSNLARSRAEAKAAADHGYVGVVADVRGKRLSPDTLAPYEHEQEDVYEVIDWISRQLWCNGQVGMYGGSYSGFAQWAALKHRVHPALKTIVPYVAGIPGMGLPMENNVFINANYEWAFYVGNNKYLDAAANNDRARWRGLQARWYAAGTAYRRIDSVDGTPNPLLQRWLQHPAYDAYWQRMVPYQQEFAHISIPVLAIDGYYNDGQASGLHYLREHARYNPRANDYLVIGPYDHFGAQQGGTAVLRGYRIDSIALLNTRELTFAWFDYVLKGGKKPALLIDRVNYEVMGANTWKHAPSLARLPHRDLTLYLDTTRLGAYHTLRPTRPRRPGWLTQTVDFADRQQDNNYNFPDPIIADTLVLPNGFAFASAPLRKPMVITGAFSGHLVARLNKQDVDFSVTLYEIMPDGRFFELTYYLGRASYAADPTRRQLLQPGVKTTIPFTNTKFVSRRLITGSRLLVVVNVNKNRFAQVNYGSGKEVSDETIADAGKPLEISWFNESFITIPVAR